MKKQNPGKHQKHQKYQLPYLDYMCNINERVQWLNIKGERFEGRLTNMDENCVATVVMDDGTIVEYQC